MQNRLGSKEMDVSSAPNLTLTGEFVEFRLPGKEWEHLPLFGEWADFYTKHLGAVEKRDKSMLDGEKFSDYINGVRYRCQMQNTIKGWVIALRKINTRIPSFDDIYMEPDDVITKIRPSGLHIFAGPNGHGKTTSLIATFDALKSKGKVLDIGDPIETIIDRPYVNQREVGLHVSSYSAALAEAVRSYYDTIIIGEIRHPEEARAALMAGRNGARVMATFHSDSIKGVLTRLEQMLTGEYKAMLPNVLEFVCVQFLIPANTTSGQVPVYETLSMTDDARNLMKDGSNEMGNIRLIQERQKAMTFSQSFERVRKRGLITTEEYERQLDFFDRLT